MKIPRLGRLALLALIAAVVVTVTGCDGDPATITFLDVLNTALLAVTAAGSLVLIRNL
jgi:hypothetical protein